MSQDSKQDLNFDRQVQAAIKELEHQRTMICNYLGSRAVELVVKLDTVEAAYRASQEALNKALAEIEELKRAV